MPIYVSILTFISTCRINTAHESLKARKSIFLAICLNITLSGVEHGKSFIPLGPGVIGGFAFAYTDDLSRRRPSRTIRTIGPLDSYASAY